ncbi:MAG: hypothetical protein M1540_04840 [Candidatus Bathyarchaeota archaeon]|nr:hypothetical protein [Candidatus Bathyarchaeota archaeon]
MEVILKQISRREPHQELINPRDYMPRVHEVQAPCQWLEHCNQGKCPAFVRLNGNFYCARKRTPT